MSHDKPVPGMNCRWVIKERGQVLGFLSGVNVIAESVRSDTERWGCCSFLQ